MHNTYSIGCIIPVYGPHKTAIMHPFDWIAAFRGLCVFSVEDLEPLIHQAVFFSLFPPSGVYSFLRQKHQAVWNQAGAAARCQEEVFSLFFSACGFCPLYIRGQWYSHAMQVGSAGPEGMSPPCVTLTTLPPPTLRTPVAPLFTTKTQIIAWQRHDCNADDDDDDDDDDRATVTTREQQRIHCNL